MDFKSKIELTKSIIKDINPECQIDIFNHLKC